MVFQKQEDSSFIINGDTLIEYVGCQSEITIPPHVQKIANRVFRDKTFITCINLSNVTQIGNEAFSGCLQLAKIMLPDKITKIKFRSFYNCFKLTQVCFPYDLIEIEPFAFCNCYSLKEVLLPYKLKYIRQGAFCGCNMLKTIVLPPKVDMVSDMCFYNCERLKNIRTLGEIKEVQAFGLCNCFSLIDINFDYQLRTIGERAFANTNLIRFNAGECLNEIGYYIFIGCKNLQEVIVPVHMQKHASSACFDTKQAKVNPYECDF